MTKAMESRGVGVWTEPSIEPWIPELDSWAKVSPLSS